jgi:hypothetical protein
MALCRFCNSVIKGNRNLDQFWEFLGDFQTEAYQDECEVTCRLREKMVSVTVSGVQSGHRGPQTGFPPEAHAIVQWTIINGQFPALVVVRARRHHSIKVQPYPATFEQTACAPRSNYATSLTRIAEWLDVYRSDGRSSI